MEDTNIVALYWQRSPQAIVETDGKYGAYCRSIAYRICRSREDAEECVNDTWLSAWNAMPDKRPDRLSPFLGRIVRNHALHRVESASRLKRGGGEAALALEELEECVAAPGDPAGQVELRELERAIDRFVASLPEDARRVFLARYWYLYPVAEIAQRLGYSESKVKSLLHRTRLRLQRSLREEGLL